MKSIQTQPIFPLKEALVTMTNSFLKKTSKQLHKTEHMVLIPPDTQTAAAETHLTRKNLQQKP